MEHQIIRKILALVVCFEPDVPSLQKLSESLQLEGVPVVWVNNGAEGALLSSTRPHVLHVIEMGQNLGVAAALNQGYAWAIQNGFDAVISFDQDSQPKPGMVRQLQQAWQKSSSQFVNLAAIGPTTVDQQSGLAMFTFAPYNWLRKRFLPNKAQLYEVDHLITSGCLIPCRVWQAVGPMNESYFIDWVDIEWCARARHQGFALLMDGASQMVHSIGEVSRPLLWRRFHLHAPLRNYYLLRNALLLARQSQFAMGWRLHHVLYALRVILASFLWGQQRSERLGFVWRGLLDGLRGRAGKA